MADNSSTGPDAHPPTHSPETEPVVADLAPEALRRFVSTWSGMVHITDARGVILEVTDEWLTVLGFSRHEVVGQQLDRFFTAASAAQHPDLVQPRREVGGSDHERRAQMLARSGTPVDVVVDVVVQRGGDAEAVGAIGIVRDITTQLETERRLRESESRSRVLHELVERTRDVRDPDEILPAALEVLGQHLGASRCAFAHVDHDGEWFTIPHDYTDDCPSTAGRYQLSLFGSQAVGELSQGRTYVVGDVDAELEPGEGADMFNAIGIKSIVCCSLVRDGVLRAMMAVHQIEPRQWTPDEVEITQEFVERCWSMIEQRRAESELRRSEALLRIANRAAQMSEWSIDVRTGVVTWPDDTCALHEVPPGTSPTQEEVLDFFVPEDRDTMRAHMRRCIDDGTPFDDELQLVSATQRRLCVRVFGLAERDRDGQIVRLECAYQDISERKAAEMALAESHESLRVTLMSIGDAVITADPSGDVEWMNPVAERLTGWSAEEARGKPLRQVFHIVDEETRQPTENPMATCLQEQRIVGLVNRTLLLSRTGEEYGIEDSAAPIRDEYGQVLGVVLVFHDVTEQRLLSGEMTYRASHDELTDLINRSEFENRLRRLLQRSHDDHSQHAMMFIDLDQFKLVNDACGHSVGDQLLQQVSALLSEAVRSHDTVARLGGDEFGVLLDHCTITQAQRIAEVICERMSEHRFQHEEHRFRVGASIGLVPVDEQWSTAAEVMQAADTACYAAKEAGRNRVHTWYDTDAAIRERQGEMQWTTRIERALDDDRFVLYGQKIESLNEPATGLHAEVLLRMCRKDGSLVQPGAFLPAAERYHLATRVDRWVLRHATDWLVELPDLAAVEMLCINLSGQSIGDRAFHRHAVELLDALPPEVCHRLCLEITETAAITNLADASNFIEQIGGLGVKIALDDFGAGASSFGYLKSLDVDILKIDGQFIKDLLDDPLDDAAVRCFVDVARLVDMKTVAEFVDRPDVLNRVRELGIDYGQGYLLHKPEPLDQLLDSLAPESVESA
ncbi:EAL domain-containing protein [Ilumatobacter coccineus]|uniref:Signaling protein n=1 Tax=Ilumatobacter coccineus (strain NBRC 103263 / KCTC 29153 / YM16-304) TaxID=1313172 RepID=A0A6C7EAD7_ILUCY|nr:EAL domain-containing protein [Ilumatobacter coccineus]BAN02095.1 hypothetical protein YM304_17810 [Ilumatobacter coccineus YM16-304]